MKIRRLEKILIYDEGISDKVNIEESAEYLRGKLPDVPVETKGAFPDFSPEERRSFAAGLASIKISDISRRMEAEEEPLYGEIEFEDRRIRGKSRAFGVVYDGARLQKHFSDLLDPAERDLDTPHIFLTNRLFATWGILDGRYHARTSLYGIPSIISTTGLVEAPARPRDYYLVKQQYELVGRDIQEVKERFRGTFIDYDDERLTEVVKGYLMQAVFYSLTGNPFCEDRNCRLFNAHWQEDLIHAQLESEYEFCDEHRKIIDDYNQGTAG